MNYAMCVLIAVEARAQCRTRLAEATLRAAALA